MKVGDWVFFKTRNWPSDVRIVSTELATGKMKDITGKDRYQGRGKIIGIAGDNYTVREEKTNRLVEVGPHPDDEIRVFTKQYRTLTLGDLRAFLKKHKDAPDDIPVMLNLPLSFFSDDDDLPPDHPEYKAVSAFQTVEASGISFTAFSESGCSADGYVPPEDQEDEDWDQCVEIWPNDEQCYDAMRETD